MNDHICGRGVCAANAGHAGSCSEASGWSYDAPSEGQLASMLRASYKEGWDAHASLPHVNLKEKR